MVDSALQTEEYFPDHVIAPGVSGIFPGVQPIGPVEALSSEPGSGRIASIRARASSEHRTSSRCTAMNSHPTTVLG